MRWRLPRSLIIDAIVCRVCDQRPWRVEGYEQVEAMGYVMRAWCHGAFRRWVIGEEVIRAGVWRDDQAPLLRAMVAFAAMLRALPPILVTIRRLRGRRLPLPPRDRLTVWVVS